MKTFLLLGSGVAIGAAIGYIAFGNPRRDLDEALKQIGVSNAPSPAPSGALPSGCVGTAEPGVRASAAVAAQVT